jgi:nicotinic acid phosphoribosyltransferase
MRQVKLPSSIIHETPMPLKADAYTVGSEMFASEKAKEKSMYYLTFRRELNKINPDLYEKGDDRIIFHGLSRILQYLFYVATNHEQLKETVDFLSMGKVTTKGLEPFPFPVEQWKRVVDEFNGRPPLLIRGVKEGSVLYPNEPGVTCVSMVDGFGELAAWFESSIIKVWASSQMVTQLVHWLEYCKSVVRAVYGNTITEERIEYLGSCMLHNFGCRAGMTPQESEWIGGDSLLVFPSTDTFSGAYQMWKNGNKTPGIYVSVQALAHRNVQGYEVETDCFRKLKDSGNPGDINSNVADCYDFWTAVEGNGKGTDNSLLGLALESKRSGDGTITIARPDSGNPTEQVLWLCRLAMKHGLSKKEIINGKEWRFGTNLKVLEGDSMKWKSMRELNAEMMNIGCPPFGWGVPYGVGGALRNISRDDLSAKYAMCAYGNELTPACKYSETVEKTTLPGPFKLLRSPEALAAKKTIVFPWEPGEDVMVDYFNGLDIWDPFKEGFGADTLKEKARIKEQMATMPKNLRTEENHGYPASDAIRNKRIELLYKYAPKKLAQNY